MANSKEDQEDKSMNGQNGQHDEEMHGVTPVSGMYESWFLDYASYVILERAVPNINDGLKPVQRRILHAMNEMHDGRFHKVANVIGQTMQYHPHGDAAIGDALVNLGQKELLIDTQGNWGDIRTGDSAAAPRYIEAKLSKFASEVVFNPKTTEWQASYDGRKKEPVNLPVKFPLLLAQGVEGIAVGLATKIMPHNFCELIKGSIDILKGKKTKIVPDFLTGGMADFSNYNEGLKGGKIKVRARIESQDKKTLLVTEIPYGTTTSSIIESIIKANDNGKLKVKKVVDNTAKDVEVQIDLPPGVNPDVTINALYAFTDCEVSISPNSCVIIDEKPHFLSVNEILRLSTEYTKHLLKRELEIRQAELNEKWHFSSLEKIFIENRIYRDIEECETWEAVIETIDKGLKPFKKLLRREVTEDDIVRLTEIKIKRISKFDSFKADEEINRLEEALAQVAHDLEHLTDYAIAYFQNLLDKYGANWERRTQIKTFDTIDAQAVAAANVKLYCNYAEGFIGYGLKRDELVAECSDQSDIIVFRKDGKFLVTRISEKAFVGTDIIYAGVWNKGDDRMVYNMAYLDGGSGKTFVKRFSVTSITRDKEYDLTKGTKNSKVLYFTANPNGESEIVAVTLSQGSKARVKSFEYNFFELAIKGRGSQGNTLTKYPVRKIVQKEVGISTIGGVDIWYDPIVGRLNKDERGDFLGNFDTNDNILVIHKDGTYLLTDFELTNRYVPEEILCIGKLQPSTIISAVHYDGSKQEYYVKRFQIETSTVGERFSFITDHKDSKLIVASIHPRPSITFKHTQGKERTKIEGEENLVAFIDVKGWKAIGNRLNYRNMSSIKVVEPELTEEELEAMQAGAGNQSSGSDDSDIDDDGADEVEEADDKSAAKAEAKTEAKEKDDDGLEVGSTVELDVKPKGKGDKEKGKDDKSQGKLF